MSSGWHRAYASEQFPFEVIVTTDSGKRGGTGCVLCERPWQQCTRRINLCESCNSLHTPVPPHFFFMTLRIRRVDDGDKRGSQQ